MAAARVVMGRVAAPWGVRGWVKVQPYTAEPGALLGYAEWWLAGRGGAAPRLHRLVEARLHGEWVVAMLEGVATREAAAGLRGCEVSVPREALPEPGDDEVYVADLVGCAVVNRAGERIGTVQGVDDAGQQRLLVERPAGGTILIPFVPAHVQRIDLEAREVAVDWQVDA